MLWCSTCRCRGSCENMRWRHVAWKQTEYTEPALACLRKRAAAVECCCRC
jgi:hypothetical protein